MALYDRRMHSFIYDVFTMFNLLNFKTNDYITFAIDCVLTTRQLNVLFLVF